jgi:hypothetical protein
MMKLIAGPRSNSASEGESTRLRKPAHRAPENSYWLPSDAIVRPEMDARMGSMGKGMENRGLACRRMCAGCAKNA